MKKNKKLDEKDPGIRWFLKTFPWVGAIAALAIGYVLADGLMAGEFVFRNTRYTGPDTVALAERPADFYIILIIVLAIFTGLSGYCAWRLRCRHRLRREDAVR